MRRLFDRLLSALFAAVILVWCVNGCSDPDAAAAPDRGVDAAADTVVDIQSRHDDVPIKASNGDVSASDSSAGGATDSVAGPDGGESGSQADSVAVADVAPPSYPLDDVLRVNHIQIKGTHNSYHRKMGATVIPQWNYQFDPLNTQLQDQGVRQIELDVHYKPGKPKATWEVFHVPFVDSKSNCKTLAICLGLVKTWSDSHPGHHLLFILIEPKDDLDFEKISGHYDELDAALLAVFPKDRVLRPDDVRGKHATLRKALETDGWPTLGKTRNKAMFLMLNSGEHRKNYLKGHPNLEDRVIFMRDGKGEPTGAVLEMGGPEGDHSKIQAAVKAGYLVRTKADDPNASDAANAKRAKAALSSGAHLISSDFPAKVAGSNYIFSVPAGTPSGCNPVSAPKSCTSKAVEAL